MSDTWSSRVDRVISALFSSARASVRASGKVTFVFISVSSGVKILLQWFVSSVEYCRKRISQSADRFVSKDFVLSQSVFSATRL